MVSLGYNEVSYTLGRERMAASLTESNFLKNNLILFIILIEISSIILTDSCPWLGAEHKPMTIRLNDGYIRHNKQISELLIYRSLALITLRWRHVNAMVSQITCNWTVYSTSQANKQGNKSCALMAFLLGQATCGLFLQSSSNVAPYHKIIIRFRTDEQPYSKP